MTDDQKISRIAEIDGKFQDATGWGSWMVMCANERERLVNDLNSSGHNIAHKYQVPTDTARILSAMKGTP